MLNEKPHQDTIGALSAISLLRSVGARVWSATCAAGGTGNHSAAACSQDSGEPPFLGVLVAA